MKILVSEKGCIYQAKNTFHDMEDLTNFPLRIFNNLVDSIKRRGYGWQKDAKENNITLDNGDVVTTFEEWFEWKGGLKYIWEIFLKRIDAFENLPEINWDNQEHVEMLKKSWWDFRKLFPEFYFATHKDEIEHGILSMNPVASNSQFYFGTLDEFFATYGKIPTTCTFIANNCSPHQQMRLNRILSSARTYDDGQGGIATLHDVYWDVVYV
jgi:hypothetical protein